MKKKKKNDGINGNCLIYETKNKHNNHENSNDVRQLSRNMQNCVLNIFIDRLFLVWNVPYSAITSNSRRKNMQMLSVPGDDYLELKNYY